VLILENARLLDVESGEARPGVQVVIEGAQIVEVADRVLGSGSARRIDLGGRTLLPGLIDAHFHAVLTESNPAHSRQTPLTLMTSRAAQLLRRALDRGFTTARDMGGADWGCVRLCQKRPSPARDSTSPPEVFRRPVGTGT
jgi:imidazolonepropionase-like amidohydrolase